MALILADQAYLLYNPVRDMTAECVSRVLWMFKGPPPPPNTQGTDEARPQGMLNSEFHYEGIYSFPGQGSRRTEQKQVS